MDLKFGMEDVAWTWQGHSWELKVQKVGILRSISERFIPGVWG